MYDKIRYVYETAVPLGTAVFCQNDSFLFSSLILSQFEFLVDKINSYNDLVNVLASSVGALSNPSKIEATFKNVIKSDISLNTIRQYIEYLKDAFVINEALRYEVKGKNI